MPHSLPSAGQAVAVEGLNRCENLPGLPSRQGELNRQALQEHLLAGLDDPIAVNQLGRHRQGSFPLFGVQHGDRGSDQSLKPPLAQGSQKGIEQFRNGEVCEVGIGGPVLQQAPQGLGLIAAQRPITGHGGQGDGGEGLAGFHGRRSELLPFQQPVARQGPPETGIRVSVHANVVDTVTTMPTPARFTLAAGLLGLGLCLLNQLTAPELNPALERAGVLASLMAVGLMLVAVLWTRALPLAPERVELEGEQGLELDAELPEELSLELAWGSRLLLTATPAASLLIHWQGRTLLRRGLLGHSPFDPGEICRRATANGRTVSLVNLKLYPGREEFSCLPVGTPAVLVQPIGSQGWLLAGGWSPRCFSRSDELWIEGWAEKLRTSLERADVALSREEAPSAPKTPAPPGS